MVPPTELCAIVRDLEEGEQYKFRVVAVNKAGRGKWSECSEQVEKKVKSWCSLLSCCFGVVVACSVVVFCSVVVVFCKVVVVFCKVVVVFCKFVVVF